MTLRKSNFFSPRKIFKLNPHIQVKTETFQNSLIFYVDNFYANPEEVEDYLFNRITPMHKAGSRFSYNGIYFTDRRLQQPDFRFFAANKFMSDLCGQNPLTYKAVTNVIRFKDHSFNNYLENYWWPHRDRGYNGIVYFNEEKLNGTNLYSLDNSDPIMKSTKNICEHAAPWRPKDHYRILKSLRPSYNKMILFDGWQFPHAMNICNRHYFSKEDRKNQAFFYNKDNLIKTPPKWGLVKKNSITLTNSRSN